MTDLQTVYKEETSGRRYHVPIVSKKESIPSAPEATDVVTLDLNKPLTKGEFKKLSDSLKALYIKHLREKYGVTLTQIANMLEYTPSHFSAGIISKLNLNKLFKTRAMQTRTQKKEWNKFLCYTESSEADTQKPSLKKSTSADTMCCSCSFILKGELQLKDITERIQAMVSDGTPCTISVSIDVSNEKGW